MGLVMPFASKWWLRQTAMDQPAEGRSTYQNNTSSDARTNVAKRRPPAIRMLTNTSEIRNRPSNEGAQQEKASHPEGATSYSSQTESETNIYLQTAQRIDTLNEFGPLGAP